MVRVVRSIATGLAIAYGAGVGLAVALVAITVYWGTIGVLNGSIDSQIMAVSARLQTRFGGHAADLAPDIRRELNDGINSDTEIFQLSGRDGRPVAGNLSTWPKLPNGALSTARVRRNGKPIRARLRMVTLPDGGVLIVGRDLGEQEQIRALIIRSLTIAGAGSVLLMLAAGIIFRGLIERRLGTIRAMAARVEAGDYAHRVPESFDDEFGRLGRDVNRMLDRIEHLMEGVRHVSNAIAHDLRTPLNRLRNKLETAIEDADTPGPLSDAAMSAVADIDELILLFENLLQIAEAESGVRTRTFDAIDLSAVAFDMAELYDATAEDAGMRIVAARSNRVEARGDRNLLANAVASLIDNAIKYGKPGGQIRVTAFWSPEGCIVEVADDGPGIPQPEHDRVTERFYRLDHGPPGHGLGLSIVSAIAKLHGGSLRLSDAQPGLCARIVLPVDVSANLSNL
jgi:signal transduction histidine kinase